MAQLITACHWEPFPTCVCGDGGHLALLPAPHTLHSNLVLGGRLQKADGVLGGIAADGRAVCPPCKDRAKSFGDMPGPDPRCGVCPGGDGNATTQG